MDRIRWGVGWAVLPVAVGSCMDWEKVPVQTPVATTSAPTSSNYDLRVTPKPRWRLYSNLRDMRRAADADVATYARGDLREGAPCWILVDFRERATFQAVELVHGHATAHPQRYRVEVSVNGWPYVRVFEGLATDGRTLAVFDRPQTVRFMKITGLEGTGGAWELAEIHLY